jgi:hypothetical protein
VDSPVSVTKDTAGSGVQADSILDAMSEDSPKTVATPHGDTLDLKGGIGFGNDTLHAYRLEVYSWNGAEFVRIKRIVSFKADGYPKWSTSIRTVIPAVADSGQAVVLQCQLVNKEDPFVFVWMVPIRGTLGTLGVSTQQARRCEKSRRQARNVHTCWDMKTDGDRFARSTVSHKVASTVP